ncbi:hypothetical protein AJ79_06222 [Helicocarpus griseus UAMH5409]|uniref:Uncharacterized protein n=1 Tax=Helicocarpus griseus UAMH5409 TaxID=1447875 RepID=A0A2B7XFQ5_9EURO|nr:hypothetical protein AJ79_06222 [Helicocarpus griseus UAMH5409]
MAGSVGVDESQLLPSNSGVPVPLPLFSPVPSYRSHSTPITHPFSPPLSPAPTVLVSLHPVERRQASSGLSLHEYRKNLSRPQAEEPLNLGPRRTLKRKPKALNLNVFRSPVIPPSPPPTPLSMSRVSSSSSLSSLQSISWLQPLEDEVLNQERAGSPKDSPYSNPVDTVRSPNTTPQSTTLYNTSSQQPQTQPPPFSLPPPPPYTPATSVASGSTGNKKLNAFRNRLKQIPVKLIYHKKTPSESALFLGANQQKTRLRHRGVSFEILNPPKAPCLPLSFPGEHIYTKPLDTLKNNTSSLFLDRMPPSDENLPDGSLPDGNIPPGEVTPVKLSSQSRTERLEQRATPPRSLFEDLPTAHSSITSRMANQRSNLFPLFPYIDHNTDNLDRELSNDLDFGEILVGYSSGQPDPSVSNPGDSASTQVQGVISSAGSASSSATVNGNSKDGNRVSRKTPGVVYSAGLVSSSAPVDDDAKILESTFSDLFLSRASFEQWSKYFSTKTSRSAGQLDGELKRRPSKLTKRPPSNANAATFGKKRSACNTVHHGASSMLPSFFQRQLKSPNSPCRVEKRSMLNDAGKAGYSPSTTRKNTIYRESVPSPLDYMSEEIEAVLDQYVASTEACDEPYPPESSVVVSRARPESSVYSVHDPLESYDKAQDDRNGYDGQYWVGTRQSTGFEYGNTQGRYRLSSTYNQNICEPVHDQELYEADASVSRAPASQIPVYPETRPNRGSRAMSATGKTSFNIFPEQDPEDRMGYIPIMYEGPGTLQSSSISAMADQDYLPDEPDDMGPGSSQTASTRQLSGLGTFSTLKSRLRFPSTLSSRSKASGLKTQQSFAMQPLSKDHKQLPSQSEEYKGDENNNEMREPEWYEKDDDDDEQDWQTVAGSQHFRNDVKHELTRVDTGSSIADCSSYGDPANLTTTEEARPWTNLPSSSLSRGYHHQHQQQSYAGPSNTNPVVVHPGQKGVQAQSHRLHQNPETGSPILIPDYQHPGRPIDNSSNLNHQQPMLTVSIDVCPAPLAAATPWYQHPTPLDKPHAHPFQTPPPVLDTRKGKARLRKQSLYQHAAARFGNSSKCSTTTAPYDMSRSQHYRQHNYNPQPQLLDGYVPPNWHNSNPPVTESLEGHPPTASSDWDTVSSAQDIAPYNRDKHYHSRYQHNNNHNPPTHNTANKNNFPQQTKTTRSDYKRPISIQYPSFSWFRTANMEANEQDSQHCLPLTTSTQPASRDVPKVPEKAHLATTFDSTDRLIPDPDTIPSPPRITRKSSREGATTGSYETHRNQSRASQNMYQPSHRSSTSGARWSFAQGSTDNQSAKHRMKMPSRDDLVRERLHQLGHVEEADTVPPRGIIGKKLALAPGFPGHRFEGGAVIPPRPYVDIDASRMANTSADEESQITHVSQVSEWYCSENGRYAFSTPPRLFKTSPEHRKRAADAAAAAAAGINFALQRRAGRELIVLSISIFPFGWFVLGCIAVGGSWADRLIAWKTKGEVDQFHYQETRSARIAFALLMVLLFFVACITTTAVLLAREL